MNQARATTPPAAFCALFSVRALAWLLSFALLTWCSLAGAVSPSGKQALSDFIEASHREDWKSASQYLPAGVATLANAQHLGYVLDHYFEGDLSTAAEGADRFEIAVNTPITTVVVSMKRVARNRWTFDALDWQKINQVFDADHPRSFEQRLPPIFRQHVFGVPLWQWVALIAATTLSLIVSWLLAWLLSWFLGRIVMRTTAEWDNQLVHAARAPLRLALFVICVWVCNAVVRFLATLEWAAYPVLRAVAVLGIAWFAVRVVSVTSKTISKKYESTDGTKYRGLRTQVAVFERILSVVIAIVGAAIILTQFEFFRTVGISLLASAGVAGVVFGLAAQRSLSGVISGILISFTQPIRIGDLVVVEGEQGTVEDITLTYVVIHVWDHRRLIVPVSRFLETPFQNWTRSSTELLGGVLLQVDYTTPIEPLRQELKRFCATRSQWDQKTCSVIVLDVGDRTCKVRCLVSAQDADSLWALQCAVREHLLDWLQGLESGRYLPKDRTQTVSSPR